MSVDERIRRIVAEEGGRAPVERVVREALGLAGATGALARRLVESAVRECPGLALDGDAVVERAAPPGGRTVALALAQAQTSTALPPSVAWAAVPDDGSQPVVVAVAAGDWREGVARIARELAGTQVLALSATSARRLLRLGASIGGVDPADEPVVVALAQAARRAGKPIRGADDAAALVGSAVPETPEGAARLLVKLAELLQRETGSTPGELAALADAEAVAEFDFSEKGFNREDLVALPEAPGVYVFEDADGEAVYVGKAQNLRRRASSYFAPVVDERATRVRDAAYALGHERTGTELSALLREQQLIRELRPPVNVQEAVHARARSSVAHVASRGEVAVVQPSADGGAEVVLLDRTRGAAVAAVVPEADPRELGRVLGAALAELRSREANAEGAADAEVALTWLADRGASASVVDASGEVDAVADLLARIARDPDLEKGQVIPVR